MDDLQEGRERGKNSLLVGKGEGIKAFHGERFTPDEPVAGEQQPVAGLPANKVKPRDRHGQTSGQFREYGNLATERAGHLRTLREAEDPRVVDEVGIAVHARSEEGDVAHRKLGEASLNFGPNPLFRHAMPPPFLRGDPPGCPVSGCPASRPSVSP